MKAKIIALCIQRNEYSIFFPNSSIKNERKTKKKVRRCDEQIAMQTDQETSHPVHNQPSMNKEREERKKNYYSYTIQFGVF